MVLIILVILVILVIRRRVLRGKRVARGPAPSPGVIIARARPVHLDMLYSEWKKRGKE